MQQQSRVVGKIQLVVADCSRCGRHTVQWATSNNTTPLGNEESTNGKGVYSPPEHIPTDIVSSRESSSTSDSPPVPETSIQD